MQLGLDVLGLSCHCWYVKLNFAHIYSVKLHVLSFSHILTVLNLILHTSAA